MEGGGLAPAVTTAGAPVAVEDEELAVAAGRGAAGSCFALPAALPAGLAPLLARAPAPPLALLARAAAALPKPPAATPLALLCWFAPPPRPPPGPAPLLPLPPLPLPRPAPRPVPRPPPRPLPPAVADEALWPDDPVPREGEALRCCCCCCCCCCLAMLLLPPSGGAPVVRARALFTPLLEEAVCGFLGATRADPGAPAAAAGTCFAGDLRPAPPPPLLPPAPGEVRLPPLLPLAAFAGFTLTLSSEVPSSADMCGRAAFELLGFVAGARRHPTRKAEISGSASL